MGGRRGGRLRRGADVAVPGGLPPAGGAELSSRRAACVCSGSLNELRAYVTRVHACARVKTSSRSSSQADDGHSVCMRALLQVTAAAVVACAESKLPAAPHWLTVLV